MIYAASSHDFRTAFRRILRCGPSQSVMDQFGGPSLDHRPKARRSLRNGRQSGGPYNNHSVKPSIPFHLISQPEKLPSPTRFPAVNTDYPLVEPQPTATVDQSESVALATQNNSQLVDANWTPNGTDQGTLCQRDNLPLPRQLLAFTRFRGQTAISG